MKIINYLLGCLLFSLPLSGQVFSPVQLLEDFDTLQHALQEGHGGLYRHHSKSSIDKHFAKYRSGLKAPMSPFEFYGHLARMLAGIGDGHMSIYHDATLMAGRPRPLLFPFRLIIEKNRAFILSNDTKDDNLVAPGMEILMINGRTIGEIKKLIVPCITNDGNIQTGRLANFERSFGEYYWKYVDTSSAFVIKLKDSSSLVFTTVINGVTTVERDVNRDQNLVNANILRLTKPLEGSGDLVSLRMLTNNIASLRIRLFDGENFTKEIDSIFALIAQQPVSSLILDLRGNRGGFDYLSAHLISKFTNKPFRYHDSIQTPTLKPSYASWKEKPPVDLDNGTTNRSTGGYLLKPMLNDCLEEQAPAQQLYTGKLIVLIDGYTFSAAADCSSILNHITDAVFVGEETGGGCQGNTAGLKAVLKLPNSHFNVNIHLWDYWSAVPAPKTKGRGVMPDYPIERKTSDWLRGIDTQWEFALKLCADQLGNN